MVIPDFDTNGGDMVIVQLKIPKVESPSYNAQATHSKLQAQNLQSGLCE